MDLILLNGGAHPAPPEKRTPFELYLASLQTRMSRESMASALLQVARKLGYTRASAVPWHLLRYEQMLALRAWLAETRAPSSGNRYMAAVRGVLREAYRLHLISTDDYHRARDTDGIKGSRLTKGRSVTPGELRALVDSVRADRLQGARDRALLAILFGAGLRRTEAVMLDVEHLHGNELRVRGKGNKERTVYLSEGAVRALEAWLRIRGLEPGPLIFPTYRDGREIKRRRLSSHAVLNILRALALRAGVKPFAPHDCRRTWVGDLLDAGNDLPTVQQLAGHEQVTTTASYDRRGERRKRDAATSITFPYAD